MLFFVVIGFCDSTVADGEASNREELKSQALSVLRVGETLSFDLGQLRVKRNYVLEIEVTNKSDREIEVSRVNADCSCTSAKFEGSSKLAPNSTSKLRVEFHTNKVKPGEWVRELVLETQGENGEVEAFCHIRLNSVVKPPLEISSSELAVNEKGKSVAKQFTITRNFFDVEMDDLRFVIANDYVESSSIVSREGDKVQIEAVGNFDLEDKRDENPGMLRVVTKDSLGELRWEFPFVVSVPSSLRIVPEKVRLKLSQNGRLGSLMLKGRFDALQEIECTVVLRDDVKEVFRKAAKFKPASNSVCPIRLEVPESIFSKLDFASAKVDIEFDSRCVSADLVLD